MKLSKIKKYVTKDTAINILVLTFVFTLAATTAYAAPNSWAKNASDWIMSGVQYVALAIVAAFAVKFIAKRQFIQFAGFLILAAFILVVIYDPQKLKTIGETLYNIIFK